MISTNAQYEAANASATSGPRDPLEHVRTLAKQFATLSADLAALGIRDRLYAVLQGVFLVGSFFRECPDAYERFKAEAYWVGVRQKPNRRNVMRSVLSYTMRTKGPGREALQNRVYKYARVLEYFYQDEVVSDEVPQRLKDGGGIDAIYAALCRSKRLAKRAYDSKEAASELPSTGNGTADTHANAVQAHEIDDGRLSSDASQILGIEGRRKSVPLATAANNATDMLRDEVQPAGRSKRDALNRMSLKTLEVQMFDFELEEVLSAKRVTIRAIVDPRDGRGWSRVVARSVLTSNRTEGPWPGHSPAMRDGNE